MLDDVQVAFDQNVCWSVRSRDGARTVRLNATPRVRSPMAGRCISYESGAWRWDEQDLERGKSQKLCDLELRLVI
jgi:hypothetical protein